MSAVRDLVARAYDASRLWKIKLFVQYDIPRYQWAAARALVRRRPDLQDLIELYFRKVRHYVACLRCGHTWATCAFVGVEYHYDWALGPLHTVPGRLFVGEAWFACICCWDELSPEERLALARQSRFAEEISAAEAWDQVDAACADDDE